ncbi:MAG: alpha/beta fold hydrolase [Chloroflexi bacterium]|nr:alpha/beta fold hydrolase [Chloroflexota bacterium]
MPFADLNGTHLYYEILGEDHAWVVVFLHAGIADSRMWDAQVEPFSQNHRVIRYDLRGFGQTTVPTPAPYSHHEDLRALLDLLEVQRVAVIGCSNGGRVAMNFTLAYPDRVSALAMICSSPGGFKFDGESPALWTQVVKAFDSGDLELTARLEAQLWAAGPERSPDLLDPALLEHVRDMDLIALKNEVADNSGEEQSFTPPAAERLSEITVPTLIMTGTQDSPVTHASGSFMKQHIAGAQKVDLPTAHLPSMERPDKFNRVVLDFLKPVLNQ